MKKVTAPDLGPIIKALQTAPKIKLTLDAALALQLISAIQLACRHPRFDGRVRQIVEEFARALSQRLPAECQPLTELGWDPENDV